MLTCFSSLCLIAVSLLTIFAPGIWFREMSTLSKRDKADAEKTPAPGDGLVSEGGATE